MKTELSNTPPQKARVFISYSHDSLEHKKRILELSNRLREDGIDAWIDQYEPHPPQGWPLWMTSELEKADWVVIVVTPEYQRSMLNPGSHTGKGVAWEGLIITQALYEAYCQNTTFIPLLYNFNDQPYIPIPLRPYTYVCMEAKNGYENLYRRIMDKPEILVPPLGEPLILPQYGGISTSRLKEDKDVIIKYSMEWLRHPNDVTTVEDYYTWHESPEFWKAGPGEMFAISNREVEALWTMTRYSTVYEVWLKRFISCGGSVSRIYILSEEYVNSSTHNLFLSVLYRHFLLGFKPKLAYFPDSDIAQKQWLRAKCDTYAVLNRDVCLLYQFPPLQYPMFVRTIHHDVVNNAIRAHDSLLPNTIEFEVWYREKKDRQLPISQIKKIEEEVDRICEIAGFRGIG